MTRRTLLVPLFAAALILAPSEISGKVEASLGVRPGSSTEAGRTEFYRWSLTSHREALGPQGRSA